MDPKIHKLLLELDNREDAESYFSWSDIQKEQFIRRVCLYFWQHYKRGGVHREAIMLGMWGAMKDAEEREDYEQAEIMNRCLAKLESWNNDTNY